MVLDFMFLKPLVKKVCDSIDHRMILPADNPWLELREEDGTIWAIHGADRFAFPKRDVIVLPIRNTSTERLAEWACGRIREELERSVPREQLHRIRVNVEESSGQCGYYEERELA
jgi:6-pyruvoyltetrahydropterin/6-carboxytetrahydropterin synthase